MTVGLIAVHALLALTVFLVLLNRYLEGTRYRAADIMLGWLWISLLGVAFFGFGRKAGLLAIALSFPYGWLSRPVAWYLAFRIPGEALSSELRRECGRLLMSGLWMLAAVGGGWMLESGSPTGRSITGIELTLVLPLWAEALHHAWRIGRRHRWIRSIAWSGVGALMATEGVVTLARQFHALLENQLSPGGLPEAPFLLIYSLGFISIFMGLSIFIAGVGFRILSDVRRGRT